MASIRLPLSSLSSDVALQTSSAVYLKKIDEVGADLYVGEAAPGSLDSSPVWRIYRITSTGPDLVILWADGNSNFDNAWSNRLSLSYS